ncbi:MAG: hypothetical protein ACOCRX_02690 [Candidatus Woesearchaeota archaeon]
MIKEYLLVGIGLLFISTFFSFYTLAEDVSQSAIQHTTQYSLAVDCGFSGIPIEECMNKSSNEIKTDMDDSLEEYITLLEETKDDLEELINEKNKEMIND